MSDPIKVEDVLVPANLTKAAGLGFVRSLVKFSNAVDEAKSAKIYGNIVRTNSNAIKRQVKLANACLASLGKQPTPA